MRRADREVKDIKDIIHIVEKAKIVHLGMIDDNYPYIVPLHFGFEYVDNTLILYLHCAKEGHKLDLIRDNPNVCIEMECDIELVSGQENPCMYGSYYASVIGRGTADIVSDTREKIKGISLLMKNQTEKSFEITEKMVASVSVIKIVVSSFTAKSRTRQL